MRRWPPRSGRLAGAYRSDLRVPKCHNWALWHSAPFGTWHFGTQLRLALGTLALSSVWHLALWHSAPFGTWHFGTQLRLALGTLALESILVIHSLAPPNSSIAFARIGTIWVTKHS